MCIRGESLGSNSELWLVGDATFGFLTTKNVVINRSYQLRTLGHRLECDQP
jgi:hypothetical protein